MEIKFKEKLNKAKDINLSNSIDTQVAICIAELMNASISLHKLHLKITGTGSYATHKALDVYGEFQDFADDLTEQYQGASEKLIQIPDKPCKMLNTTQEAITYLSELKSMITDLQAKLEYSEVVNLLDEIKSLINKTKYKLKFLS